MSAKHPIIAITGSSGAGTTTVQNTFESIFRRWPPPRLRVADRGLREGMLLALMEGVDSLAPPKRKRRRRGGRRKRTGSPTSSNGPASE